METQYVVAITYHDHTSCTSHPRTNHFHHTVTSDIDELHQSAKQIAENIASDNPTFARVYYFNKSVSGSPLSMIFDLEKGHSIATVFIDKIA